MTTDAGVDAGESESSLLDPAYIEGLRRQMVKFASLQLGDGYAAEDVVQDALLAAMTGANRFAGRSALKTWVFAILKNKIIDTMRQKQRLVNASSLLGNDEEDEDYSELFDRGGFWNRADRPVAWGQPEDAMHQKQFWRVFEACLELLPPKQARIFMMREFIELSANEICQETGVTGANLYVILHRSRLRLRECLETQWIERGS